MCVCMFYIWFILLICYWLLPTNLMSKNYSFFLSKDYCGKYFPAVARSCWCQVFGVGANMLKRELPLCLSETVRVATVPDLCFNNPIDVTLHLVNLSFPTPPVLSLPHWQFITAYPELIQALHFWCKKHETHFITFMSAGRHLLDFGRFANDWPFVSSSSLPAFPADRSFHVNFTLLSVN